MNDQVLLNYIKGSATSEEIEEVVNWLDADPQNMQEYLLLRRAYDVFLWQTPIVPEKANRKKKISIVKEALKWVAVIALVVTTYHLFISDLFSPKEIEICQTIFTPEGQRAEVTLSDGTKVWLNAKSTLTFPDKFVGDQRHVHLIGEAYFDVAHDETKQFVVETEQYKVKVLGTEFNVKSHPHVGLFETSLVRGSVKISTLDDIDQDILKPGDLIYADQGGLTKTSIGGADLFAWKDGILSFKDLTFREILDKLSLYYNVKFTIKNKTVLNDQYTGKFWIKDGVEQVLRVLQGYNKFNYEKDEMNHIIIY